MHKKHKKHKDATKQKHKEHKSTKNTNERLNNFFPLDVFKHIKLQSFLFLFAYMCFVLFCMCEIFA